MVAAKGGNGRCLRKYKLFFLFGCVILAFQVFLAARFFQINTSSVQDEWNPQNWKALDGRKPNATVLRLDELDFKPECEITGKEAVLAIHRARSQKCKQFLANVTCLSLAGQLYPHHISGSCPGNGKVPGKALGCFKDENNYRLLNGYYGVNKKANSPDYCMQLCLQSGFPYAGVQYSNECFCGNDEPPVTSKLPDSSCNMKCPGDKHATCGGYFTINVYETGIQKFIPQTANLESASTGKLPVKIVFLLTLNGRALRQVNRLLKILYNQRHFYYIHVDVREDYLFRELLQLEKRFPNIKLTRKRFATIWGGASLLKMLLSCMNELLQMDNWHWDFVLNLSESDYPVKLVSSLEQFLTANRDRNFVKSHGRDTQRFLQKQGLDKTFVECDMRMWRVADRQLPSGLQMDGGSDWIALSRNFVSYVAAEQTDHLVSGLKQVFHYTLLPAESFFHTALRNSRFCNTYIDNNLHVTNWKRKLGCKCQYKHVVDWCGCSPNDFRPDDWPRIQTTQPRQLYFARKFEPIINQAVLLKLELWLYGLDRPSRDVKNLHSYWQSMFHHLDLSPQTDDGLKTVVTAASRVWASDLAVNESQACEVSIKKIVEVTSFHSKDSYKFTLVHFKVDGISSGIEVAFRPVAAVNLVTPSSLTKRIEELNVSSDYDQKEQMSRNFGRILSPYAEPVLTYRFSLTGSTDTDNVTCLWIDPTGFLVEVTEISIDETAIIGHTKPALKQPHLPGIWTVKLVHKQLISAEVRFLITPLEFFSGLPVSKKQAHLLHSGSVSGSHRTAGFNKYLDNNSFSGEFLKRASELNSRKVGRDLRNWIDSLFRKFYVIEDACGVVVDAAVDVCKVRLSACHRTSWSSFAPDPKSEIGTANRTTGAFDIW